MRRFIHWLIVRYLRSCAGAFHTFPYGPKGRYVVLMNERQYHEHMKTTLRPHLETYRRCSCKDFPGADEFCMAHKVPYGYYHAPNDGSNNSYRYVSVPGSLVTVAIPHPSLGWLPWEHPPRFLG